ncbi:hypothetical protein Mapa_001660 [Marchantia paleacea]|nr:hypothetical protein Mapa_001660 [Marchantia paleacea]
MSRRWVWSPSSSSPISPPYCGGHRSGPRTMPRKLTGRPDCVRTTHGDMRLTIVNHKLRLCSLLLMVHRLQP